MILHQGIALWLLERGFVPQAAERLAELSVEGLQLGITADQHRGGTARELTVDRLAIE
ncbi:hypothetical protein KBY66_03580 [Synechococcus sp. Tobar12-5m-g]|nr:MULTISPECIES: hypothetical protein [unclassified Synechococcus]MCP9771707.1 hypothetical protein [Synechococcus sp. Tobar12-5m-g]MCP9872648.1 hypothetical protein [Synechococcus sp. Cruz CV-v-12]